MLALHTAQASFSGAAKKAGINNENDLIAVIKETREN